MPKSHVCYLEHLKDARARLRRPLYHIHQETLVADIQHAVGKRDSHLLRCTKAPDNVLALVSDGPELHRIGRHVRSHRMPARFLALGDTAAGDVVIQAGDWAHTLDLVVDIGPLAEI